MSRLSQTIFGTLVFFLAAFAVLPWTKPAYAFPNCSNIPGAYCASTGPCPATNFDARVDTSCPTAPQICCVPKSYCEDKVYVSVFDDCLTYNQFIGRTLNWAIIFAALLALIRLTIGGIQYIFSRGQPDKMESAQATMTSAIFGLILVFIAWLLMQFLGDQTPDWWKIDFFSLTET